MHHGHNSSNDKSTFLAFLAGAATAVAVGGYYLYGKNGKQHRRKVEHWALNAKAEILDKMRKSQDLTEEQYHKIVDQVTSSYSSAKDVGRERAERAATSFKRKWNDMRDMAKQAADEARLELEREDEALEEDRSGRAVLA